MKIKHRFRCECGAEFDNPMAVQEPRGEYWGMPCHETMWYCPECGDDCFWEIKDNE